MVGNSKSADMSCAWDKALKNNGRPLAVDPNRRASGFNHTRKKAYEKIGAHTSIMFFSSTSFLPLRLEVKNMLRKSVETTTGVGKLGKIDSG